MRIIASTLAVAFAVTFAGAPVAEGASAKTPASKTTWQYKWWKWLPANWVAVARCETGLNFRHSNSSYVSAFGIQRGAFNGAYDSDARKAGMPPWNDARPPTPWQQYRTALSHYRSFGDGWGCPGP